MQRAKHIGSRGRCSVKKVFLKVWQKSKESICVGVSFLMNATLLKNRLRHRFFPVNFAKIFRALFFYRTTSRRLLLKTLLIYEDYSRFSNRETKTEVWEKFFENCITWEYVSFDSLCLYNPNQAWNNFGHSLYRVPSPHHYIGYPLTFFNKLYPWTLSLSLSINFTVWAHSSHMYQIG